MTLRLSGGLTIPQGGIKMSSPEDIPTDPYWANVVYLVSGNGTNGATSTTDLSTSNHTITFSGDCAISTEQQKYGIGSVKTTNNTDSGIYTESHADFAMGTTDFTIECWYRPISKLDPYPRIFQIGPVTWGNANCFTLLDRHNSAPTKFGVAMYALGGNGILLESTTTVVNGTWYHLALEREGSVFGLFVDGILEDTYVNVGALGGDSTNIFHAGFAAVSGNADDESNGYLNDIRITKGIARYGNNFTPPTESLPTQGA
jgi:hypothetical protein